MIWLTNKELLGLWSYQLERYINLIDMCGYRHNYEGFGENFTYSMSIHRGRIITTQGVCIKSCGKSLIYYLSLLVKSDNMKV